MPVDYSRYPSDWAEIRSRILKRADHRCERCGVPNHAVGYRDERGRFVPLCGNGPCDAAGRGCSWPDYRRLSYRESREFVDLYNDHGSGRRQTDGDGNHWIVIVLTIAHLDHDVTNNDDLNLAAYCNQCHLRHDARHHASNARRTRMARKAVAGLFEEPS